MESFNVWNNEIFIDMGRALQEFWPDVDTFDASYEMWQYIGVIPGTTGYDWSYPALLVIAEQYVNDFGEKI